MIIRSRTIIDDPTIASDNISKKRALRDERIGHRQKSLLMNDTKRSFGSESEFYVFRYLASEGFLPGYNFTRLPIRAFLGQRHMDKGEYISRPRFVALREFGPNNLIYHNGGKFLINRMQLPNTEVLQHTIKVSTKTGYAFLDEEGKGMTNDPITGEELKGQDMTFKHNNLLELGECDARPQERISCEEEERTSRGFEIDQYFSFPKGIENTKQLTVKDGSDPLLQIIYAQSASLIQINRRWRTSKKDVGFNIGQNSGRWFKEKDSKNLDDSEKPLNVRLYTTDTADVLYIQPVKELGLDEGGVISLAYALKRAVEKEFQVEEGEIGVWIMGEHESRNIMIYEAAEGSLGVLSQMIIPQKLSKVFKRAYEICHFDPNQRTDKAPELPKATYDDLLSYFNQRHHDVLDRRGIKTALEKLMDSRLEGSMDGISYSDKYEELLKKYDLNSGTEKMFIDYLYKHGLALPDRAQFNVPGCYANADFVYKTQIGFTLIFCDGSVHDETTVKEKDSSKRKCCRDQGYDVIEWHYTESLSNLTDRRKDIFRKVN